MNKPSKAIIDFKELMISPRSSSDTFGIGDIKNSSSIEVGQSSKSVEQRNAKPKGKPTCHHCGKLGYNKHLQKQDW